MITRKVSPRLHTAILDYHARHRVYLDQILYDCIVRQIKGYDEDTLADKINQGQHPLQARGPM
jgi:hypothetical protein